MSDLRSATSRIVLALLDTVSQAGTAGAPMGAIYLALAAHGATFHQFESLVSCLQMAGLVSQQQDVLHIQQAGVALIETLTEQLAATA